MYDLALIDSVTCAVTMPTNDPTEEAMPCFSPDGKSIYYTAYNDGIGSICRMEADTYQAEVIYAENSVNAYYPITSGDRLYFTKWFSSENRCD